MGIFTFWSGVCDLVIPQIGFLSTLLTVSFKNMPQYIIDNIPVLFPNHGLYIVFAQFFDKLIDFAIGLPVVGFYFDSLYSLTLMDYILPLSIVCIIQLLLFAKAIKLLRDIF